MGQSKGYTREPTVTGGQKSLIDQLMGMATGPFQQAQQGYAQFLPGGGGGQAISDAAHQRFQQQTIPSIMNAFGSGSKTSSALNQALAAGASNLNTDIASQLAQMQLQASQGMGGLASILAQLGLTPQFALQQPSGGLNWGGAGKGALTGAGTGATAGSLIGGPVGAGVGAGVGGLVGGGAGLFS